MISDFQSFREKNLHFGSYAVVNLCPRKSVESVVVWEVYVIQARIHLAELARIDTDLTDRRTLPRHSS